MGYILWDNYKMISFFFRYRKFIWLVYVVIDGVNVLVRLYLFISMFC